MLETQDREQRKFGIRTVLSSQYVSDFPDAILNSANSLYMMEVDPKDEKLLTDTIKVPKVTLQRFQRLGSGPAADGSGVPFLGVFRIKGGGTLARILKNAMGPLSSGWQRRTVFGRVPNQGWRHPGAHSEKRHGAPGAMGVGFFTD
ncbi:hypothetical protein AO286_05910 [Pseudomonas syringae]|nr:hypothetical protein AO286_05910 [Pseudomonas syringae]